MPNSSPSSNEQPQPKNESPLTSSDWPTTSPPSKSVQEKRRYSRRRSTSAKRSRNRRAELLRQLKVDRDVLVSHPKITPRFRQDRVDNDRLIEVLSCDDQPESAAFVRCWESLTPQNRSIVGIEAIALACGLTPRRVYELFKGASFVQDAESTQVKIAESMPRVIDRVIKTALTAKGEMAQERLMKAARILPTPKGSTTVINMLGRRDDDDDDEEMTRGGDLESADDFMLRASKAMGQKALPAPVVDAEVIEDEGV